MGAIERSLILAVDDTVAVVIEITRIASAVGVVIGAITRWPRLSLTF
jgi:hypothetical protein